MVRSAFSVQAVVPDQRQGFAIGPNPVLAEHRDHAKNTLGRRSKNRFAIEHRGTISKAILAYGVAPIDLFNSIVK
jgi:hypothetical protein